MPRDERGIHDDQLDPVYRNSLRECRLILFVLGACLLWTVGYSWYHGYRSPSEPLKLTLGIPSWVFWGVLVPWGVATALSVAFGLFWMVDEPLGEENEESEDMPVG
jgi:hypothetical protein